MLSKDEKIQMIADHEIDRMTLTDLQMYAEEHMVEYMGHMLNEEVDDLFLEVMNGKLI